tara:strand:+ start:114 stop:548 length:435 start_codon:yes stop_codon:yes gene_type:complete
MHHCLKIFTIILSLTLSKASFAETIQIAFTEDDSYSIEVAYINIGDTIEWLPKNEGHNVEFFAGPDMNSLPPTSEIDEIHSVVFKVPGIYLYGCTPHADMGMLGLIVVGNDLHNLEAIKSIQLTRVAKSVLQRFIEIVRSGAKT